MAHMNTRVAALRRGRPPAWQASRAALADGVPFGRQRQWQWLVDVLFAPSPAAVVYLYGEQGVGKTLLIATFLATPTVEAALVGWTSGTRGLHGVLEDLAVSLSSRTPEDLDADRLISLVGDEARRVIWVVDDYDKLSTDDDDALRRDVLRRLPAHGSVILLGRTEPERLWSGALFWRQSVPMLRLDDWTRSEQVSYLAQNGVEDPGWIRPIHAITEGKPSLTELALQGVRWICTADPEIGQRLNSTTARSSFLVEQILHPGSARISWRAGLGYEGRDACLAAASLFGVFNRTVLQAALGKPISPEIWQQILDTGMVRGLGAGYFHLTPSLAAILERVLIRERPWSERTWRRQALGALLARLQSEGPQSLSGVWPMVARLARRQPWQVGLHPWGDDPEPYRTHWDRSEPDYLVAEDADGHLAGWIALKAVAAGTAQLVGQPGAGRDGLAQLLIRDVVPGFANWSEIVWRPVDFPGPALELEGLGFHPGGAVADGSLRLDLRAGITPWLASLIADPCPVPGSAAEVQAWTRMALCALEDADQLAVAYRTWGRSTFRDRETLRKWIVDALYAVQAGPDPVLADLLRNYYIKHQGSHEQLAEWMHVSRATYFRMHRKAMRALADKLWPAPAGMERPTIEPEPAWL